MLARTLCSLAAVATLAGCSFLTIAPAASELPWHDQRFGYDPALVDVSGADVFRLDPQLAALLADPAVMRLNPYARSKRLLTLIFGPNRDQFAYEAGHSTIAAQTWQRRRGDCISLTILAYSAAKALRLDAQIQEVRVPAVYVRRAGIEYVNHHVDMRISLPPRVAMDSPSHLIIDFDPNALAGLPGFRLSDEEVVARLYSNLGAEALTGGDARRAYAYLKTALMKDPAHAPSYTNIALLYRNQGLDADAEKFLRHGVALSTQPDTAMRALHALLADQGRAPEAQALLERLRAREDSDPAYWVTRGARALAEGRPADAVRALEKAQSMSFGFGEVHRQLAVAYWQLGKHAQAKEQVALLAAIERGSPLEPKFKKMLAQ